MGIWGVAVESEYGSQHHLQCSNNMRRVNSASTSAPSGHLVVSPYFKQQPHLSHDVEIIIKPQKSNKRRSRSLGGPRVKAKAKAEANSMVTAEEKVVSPYFQKNHEDEGVITTISSNKVKMKTKVEALNSKSVVSPCVPHEKNEIVVVSKSETKASQHFQPQQDQRPSPLKKQRGDNASMNKKRLVSPYFPHGVDGIVVSSKGTLKNKKEKNDAYMRKSQDNAWVPPRSGHDLLQEKYYEDPWKVLVICMLLNKTSGNQARNVIQDLFELCPNAEAATKVEIKELEKVIRSLGLQNKRSEMIQKLSEHYLRDDWTHVDDLPGIGKYAADAYAIFCTGHWKDVVPDDHKLVPYWKDLWISEKSENCCKDKIMDS